MKLTKKQEERLVLLKTENIYNPIRLHDRDVFTKFEIGNLFEEPRKTGNWITVNAVLQPHDHETLSDYTNYFFKTQWQIFISPRGKMFAPTFPDYLKGRKKTYCGQITLSNIV